MDLDAAHYQEASPHGSMLGGYSANAHHHPPEPTYAGNQAHASGRVHDVVRPRSPPEPEYLAFERSLQCWGNVVDPLEASNHLRQGDMAIAFQQI